MSLNHKKGYATVAEAQRSKAAGLPGAVIDDKCPCKRMHVVVPKPRKATAAEVTPAPRAKQGSMSAAVALVLAGAATVAQASWDFEVDPDRLENRAWAEAKRIVRERDSHTCGACGGKAVDVHHRVRRGSGGTSDPIVGFSPVNLVAMCRADHDRAHQKDPDLHVRGFWLTTDQGPADVPVYALAEYGYERYWLLPSGGTTDIDPREAAAA